MLINGTTLSVVMEVADENIQRFTVELEFVQCLANPEYLNCTLYFIRNIP